MSIKLNAQSGGSVALDAPTQTTSSADNVYKLPVADGSAGQVLKTDGSGNLSWVSQPTGGLEMLDVWTISAEGDATSSSGFMTSNWVRANSYTATIGSAMTESSGVFTFPSTGIYEVIFCPQYTYGNQYSRRYLTTQIHKDISGTVTQIAEAVGNMPAISGSSYAQAIATTYFDVTNTSTHKIKFKTLAENSTAIMTGHSNNFLYTFASFKKLGDT